MSLRIHFHGLRQSEAVKRECERLVSELRDEFPGTSKFEVSLGLSGEDHQTNVHITGKDLDVASSSRGRELRDSITAAFERVRRQLRKHHDKQIFSRRRESHRAADRE